MTSQEVRVKAVVRNVVTKSDGTARPFIGLEDVEGGSGRLLTDELSVKAAYDSLCHEPGDVLFGKLRPYLAKSYLASRPGTATGELIVLRPSSELEPRYFLYVTLSSPWLAWANATSYGTKMPRTSWEGIADFRMWLPPRDEQRRIADFLDEAMAHLDLLSESLMRTQGLLYERDSACMSLVFDGGRNWGSRQSGAPCSTLALRRVVAKWVDYRGATPTKVQAGVPLVTAKNIKNGVIDLDVAPEFIGEDDYIEWMRRGLPELGDVLLTTEAPLGEVAMVVDPGIALAQRVILMRANCATVSSEWIYWYLRSPQGQHELVARSTGSTALGIKADRLKGVPIPVFASGEMESRLKWLSSRIDETRRLKAPIRGQLALLAERRQALITAAVTGEIDTTMAQGVDA